jgi:hypothetical protein
MISKMFGGRFATGGFSAAVAGPHDTTVSNRKRQQIRRGNIINASSLAQKTWGRFVTCQWQDAILPYAIAYTMRTKIAGHRSLS